MEEVRSEIFQLSVLYESHSGGDRVGGNGGGGGGGGGDCGVGMPSSSLPRKVSRPIKGVRESGPTAFLLKTFAMVDDPQTNSIISWSSIGTSFTIWDTDNFCRDILPKYFKSNKFSSFISQLNMHGFKKITWQLWEYAHEEFQEGKKHLLKNIKRRNPQSRVIGHDVATKPHFDSEIFEFEAKVEKLRNDSNKLNEAIQKLEQKQQDMENDFATFKEYIQNFMCTQQKLVISMANAVIPAFVQTIEKGELDKSEMAKRQKLVAPESIERSMGPMDTVVANATGLGIEGKNRVQQELTPAQSEIQIFSSFNNSSNLLRDQMDNAIWGTNLPALSSEDFTVFEKLMDDDLICENEPEGELANQHSKIVMEFEDLIGKPAHGD